ncbi:TPA: hypothetical protein I9Y90_000052 [Elizabethkingia anophelis]|nr:hypothetical protein [Elizabethkingia anophelis]HAT4009575.1 hypothetical protein [Elizabethkingia anophelis]
MATSLEEIMNKKKAQLAQTFRDLPAICGEEMVDFTLENFEMQGFQGETFQEWPQRKNPTKWGKKDDSKRPLLVKRGKLKASIRIISIKENEVIVGAGGTDVPYAKAHNEGFEGKVTQNVGEHTRKTKTGDKINVSAFTRTINQKIPKRKYIGTPEESSRLKGRLMKICVDKIRKTLKP